MKSRPFPLPSSLFPPTFGAVLGIVLLMLLSVCPMRAFAASEQPKAYVQAKEALDKLRADAKKSQYRDNWINVADAFYAIYLQNPDWHNRPAALIRSARALDGMARVSRVKKDADAAISRYLDVSEKHPSSPLADDALYEAALVYHELLKDEQHARLLLDRIRKEYPKADFAPRAESYLKKIQKPDAASPSENIPANRRTNKTDGHTDLSQWAKPSHVAAQFGLGVNTIILDAGHGGKDVGAQHNGVTEKEICLDLAGRIAKILRAQDFKVFLTRDADKFLSLTDRSRFAVSQKGDLFVSIHVNANEDKRIAGLETYYLDFAGNRKVIALAARENSGINKNLGEMEKILTEMLLTARVHEARQLAAAIQESCLAELKKKGYKTRNGGAKGAPFYVLIGTSMPGVLVEAGYCTNSAEAKKLREEPYRKTLAAGIAAGILQYVKKLQNGK